MNATKQTPASVLLAAVVLAALAILAACAGRNEAERAGPVAPTSPTVGEVSTTTTRAPRSASSAATVSATAGRAPAVSPSATPTTAPPETAPNPTDAAASTPASASPAPAPDPAAEVTRQGPDGFTFRSRGIDGALRARLEPTSWRPGCPVGLDELRYLQISYWGFEGEARAGELVVHVDQVEAMHQVFAALWLARFQLRSMRLIDDFGGDDFSSIEADNTSAFNCRFVEGTTRWSNHATGRAIDINPLENPYVTGGNSSHPGSQPFLDRRPPPPGAATAAQAAMILEGGPVTAAFDAVGWGWGGRWGEPLDYQHFSASGS